LVVVAAVVEGTSGSVFPSSALGKDERHRVTTCFQETCVLLDSREKLLKKVVYAAPCV